MTPPMSTDHPMSYRWTVVPLRAGIVLSRSSLTFTRDWGLLWNRLKQRSQPKTRINWAYQVDATR